MLEKPLARELLHDAPVMHLAYTGRDGYPRVIPTGFNWKGGRLVTCTAHNAPKVPELRSNPRVAVNIDTLSQPPRILLEADRAGRW